MHQPTRGAALLLQATTAMLTTSTFCSTCNNVRPADFERGERGLSVWYCVGSILPRSKPPRVAGQLQAPDSTQRSTCLLFGVESPQIWVTNWEAHVPVLKFSLLVVLLLLLALLLLSLALLLL